MEPSETTPKPVTTKVEGVVDKRDEMSSVIDTPNLEGTQGSHPLRQSLELLLKLLRTPSMHHKGRIVENLMRRLKSYQGDGH